VILNNGLPSAKKNTRFAECFLRHLAECFFSGGVFLDIWQKSGFAVYFFHQVLFFCTRQKAQKIILSKLLDI